MVMTTTLRFALRHDIDYGLAWRSEYFVGFGFDAVIGIMREFAF